MDAILLQPWTTARASATSGVLSITQDEEAWLDLGQALDATFWIDVPVVTTAGSTVFLNLESAPTKDESLFQPITPPVALSASASPVLARTVRSASTAPLSRWVRWRLSTPSGSGTWDATFRVRVVPSQTQFFVPTDLAGCTVWLRGDLGITASGGVVSAWADQSGSNNNASSSGAAQPQYVQNAMNGLPAIKGDGLAYYMSTAAFQLQRDATFIAAVEPLVSPQLGFARLLETNFQTAFCLLLDSGGSNYKWIVATPGSPYGTVSGGGCSANQIQIVSATNNNTSATLYLNGLSVSSGTMSAPGTTNLPLYIMRDFSGASTFFKGYFGEAIIYNRALSASELTRVHRYLGGRYGVSVP